MSRLLSVKAADPVRALISGPPTAVIWAIKGS